MERCYTLAYEADVEELNGRWELSAIQRSIQPRERSRTQKVRRASMTSPKPRPALCSGGRAARRSPRSLVLLAAFVCVCSPVWAHLPPAGVATARADVTAPRLGRAVDGTGTERNRKPGSSLEAAAAKAGDTGEQSQ